MNVHVVLLKCLLKSPLRVIKFSMQIPLTNRCYIFGQDWQFALLNVTSFQYIFQKKIKMLTDYNGQTLVPIVSAE